jgi:hypothetical protein
VTNKKEEKISPKGSKEKGKANYLESKKFKRDLRETLLFSVLYVPFMAILYGTLAVYFPVPIPLFLGLYLDVSSAVGLFAVPLYLLIVGAILAT